MSYINFFNENVDEEYKSFYKTCSWVNLYYGIVSKAINENNFKQCAEVGIGYGYHAMEILMNSNVEKLYLVDPYTYYPNDGFVDDVNKFGGFEKLANNVKINLEEYSERYTWFRQPSLTITTEQIPHESLDLVFIDGDHSYDAVTKDLKFWFQKIRKYGWLLGDDYGSCHPGTRKAVDDFAKEKGLKINFFTKEGKTYPIYYFIKNS